MENLIFSLNATLPIFLTMILGGFFRKVGIMDSAFVAKAKKYNLLLVPGSAFMCPGYVRIAYCVDTDMIKRSFDSFEKLAAEYSN